MPATIPPANSTADSLHARIEDELPDRGHNTAAAVRSLLHAILAAQPAALEPEAAPAE